MHHKSNLKIHTKITHNPPKQKEYFTNEIFLCDTHIDPNIYGLNMDKY